MFFNLLAPLADSSDTLGFLRLFGFTTFRTGAAMLTALLVSLLIGGRVIAWLKSRQGEGQPIRSDGPETHAVKKGTPTMGGLMILIALTVTSLLWMDWLNPYTWTVLGVTLAFGFVGFLDDFAKLTRRSHKGASVRLRLLVEFGAAALAAVAVSQAAPEPLSTRILFPFFREVWIDGGLVLFMLFVMLVITSSANAVNFTDGLDGLAIMPVVITALSFGAICYVVGHVDFSRQLLFDHLPRVGEMAVFCGALAGAGLGFLWYNAPPARVFMGDTGSLSLGGALGTIAVISKHEFVLVIIGGIFVIEAVSVILQVASFKSTGKRIFLMAPLHHHFEKKGWKETTVVVRFWIISIVLALIGLSTLKLR